MLKRILVILFFLLIFGIAGNFDFQTETEIESQKISNL